jgi:hypothetical protein
LEADDEYKPMKTQSHGKEKQKFVLLEVKHIAKMTVHQLKNNGYALCVWTITETVAPNKE